MISILYPDHFRNFRAHLTSVMFVLLMMAAGSLSADPRFRADDGNLWHLGDNPALAAVSGDAFSAGFAANPNQWDQGPRDLELISPFLSFGYTWQSSRSNVRFGTALGPWAGLSLGYMSDSPDTGNTLHDFGLIYRPLDLVSTALTVDDAFGPGRESEGLADQ